MTRPQCVVIGGPNGAGKTSAAPALLKDTVGVDAFVNADVIAQGLAAFSPESVSTNAGRIMLGRLTELVDAGEDFAFESTLSGRTVLNLLERAASRGYDVHVFYLWLPTADLALARVRHRVELGGHNVAEDVVRRRFVRSSRNLRRVWSDKVTTWRLYDASGAGRPVLVARGADGQPAAVLDEQKWAIVLRQVEEAG